MGMLVLAIYLIIIGAIGLFGISLDSKIPALLALIAGIIILVTGLVPISWPVVRKD